MDVAIAETPDPLEHLEIADREVIRVGRQVAGQHRAERVRMNDAARSPFARGQAEDRVALARPEVRIVRAAQDRTVGRVDREELVRLDALLVNAGRCEQQPATIGRSADPATGPRDPAPGVERAEQLDQELARGLLRLAHEAPADAWTPAERRCRWLSRRQSSVTAASGGKPGGRGAEQLDLYLPAMRFLNRFVDSNDREIRRLQPLVDATNALEAEYEAMSDEEIRAAFDELRADVLEAAAPDEPSDDELHHPTSSAAASCSRSAASARTPGSRPRSTRSCPTCSR